MMNDKCISFNLDNNAFRGRIVRLDNVMREIFARSTYPDNVSAAIAETSALSVLIASLMKYEGLFTLQLQGSGPISVLVADVTSKGKVRATAKYDAKAIEAAQALRKTKGLIEPTPHWLEHGNLIFTVDQGKNTELYQGIVDLQGKTLSECALRYFKNSEQIDTYLRLYLNKQDNIWQSAGLLIQKMPVQSDKITQEETDAIQSLWEEDKILLDSLQKDEIFNLDLSEVLFRLYHEHQIRIVKENKYSFECRCSRDKLLTTLRAMKENDIDAMVENGKITATCNFCGQIYSFDKSELLKH